MPKSALLTYCVVFVVANSLLPAGFAVVYRHEWQVGRLLEYQRTAETLYLNGNARKTRVDDKLRFTILSAEDKKFRALLLRDREIGGRAVPTDGVIFDVDSQGRLEIPPLMADDADRLQSAFFVIPMLPSGLDIGTTWVTLPDYAGQIWHCERVECDSRYPDAVHVKFVLEDATGVNELFGRTIKGEYWLAPASGVLLSVKYTAEDASARSHQFCEITLQAQAVFSSQWCMRRVEEVKRVFQAERRVERVLALAESEPGECALQKDRLRDYWIEASRSVSDDASNPIQQLINGRIRWLPAMRARIDRRLSLTKRWLNRPARSWSLLTLAGKPISSEDIRGKKRVELFWSVNSLDSVRALVELKRRADLLDADIAVICLCVDEDPKAARRVAKTLGKGLVHVAAEPLKKIEKIPELPTFRVIDKRGVVTKIAFALGETLTEKTQTEARAK